jgi:hypothetical protein
MQYFAGKVSSRQASLHSTIISPPALGVVERF